MYLYVYNNVCIIVSIVHCNGERRLRGSSAIAANLATFVHICIWRKI